MGVASLQRVKRREKILLAIAIAVALLVYRAAPAPASPDSQVFDGILKLQPIGVDGRLVPVLLIRGLYELAKLIAGVPLAAVIAYTAAAFGASTCLLAYFIYRELFGQRYIGIVALALIGSAPAFASATAGAGVAVVGIFFIASAVYAWLKQRWFLWGITTGLALASNFASATLVFPLLSWVVWSRTTVQRPWRIIAGTVIAILIASSSYFWALSSEGGFDSWVKGRLEPAFSLVGFATPGMEQLVYVIAYAAASLALIRYLRNNALVGRVTLSVFAVGIPYTLLLLINSRSLLGEVGALLLAIALLSVLPLCIVDASKREITFLLCWLTPLLILVPLVARESSGLFLFAVFPLALLSCRLLDRTLDGEWLDYWWALGLPSDWYYRLGKLVVLLVLALSFVQATRLRS